MGRGAKPSDLEANQRCYLILNRANQAAQAGRASGIPPIACRKIKKLGKLWEISALRLRVYILCVYRRASANCATIWQFSSLNLVFWSLEKQHAGYKSQNFPLISINSHGIPSYTMGRESNGATRTPKAPSQVSYRHPDHRTRRSDAQASRHPPRWHALLDIPGDGTRAAD